MAFDPTHDQAVRMAAFEWLAAHVRSLGEVFTRDELASGFEFRGERVILVGPQGIFKPRILELPLSITTSPDSPYADAWGSDGLLRYQYRGTDREHPDNRGLRFLRERGLPLVYFHGLVPGKYMAAWPAFIVHDDPHRLEFSVAIDTALELPKLAAKRDSLGVESHDDRDAPRREYVTATVRVRLHQGRFRERVLEAYRRQCALCRLRHEELLDAAHILPDSEPEGEPRVQNGLALCSLHHSAFDRYFIGIRPDFTIEVRSDLLREHDGPTLRHAIQALHDQPIQLPRRREQRPEERLVEERYRRFRSAAGA